MFCNRGGLSKTDKLDLLSRTFTADKLPLGSMAPSLVQEVSGAAGAGQSGTERFNPSCQGPLTGPLFIAAHCYSICCSFQVNTRWSPQPRGLGSFFTLVAGSRTVVLARQDDAALHQELIYGSEAPRAPGTGLATRDCWTHLLLPKAEPQTSSASILCMHFIISLGQKLS